MNDAIALKKLLTSFRVQDLGDGDEVQGINTLVAMAISLANLTPDENWIVDSHGRNIRLGVNLFVTGSVSSGAISDDVISQIDSRQKNLNRTLQRYLSWIKEQKAKPMASLPPQGDNDPGTESCLSRILQNDHQGLLTEDQEWENILTYDSTESFSDFLQRPNFFVAASRPRNLASEITALRPGHPLVHLGLSHPSDIDNFSEPGAELIEGRFTTTTGEPVRGNILMTDPLELLKESAKNPTERSAWLKQFLWLCDSSAGPDVSALAPAHGDSSPIRKRYNFVLNRVLVERLNRKRINQMSIALDTRASVIRFRAFLNQMEPQLPGITGACRNLINSLAFGLGEMAQIKQQFPVSPEAVEELAMLLVRRMANARNTMLHDAALKQRQKLIKRIFNKLAKGEYNTRTIYKDLSMAADECRSCLTWLENSELIYLSREKWHLADNAELSFSNSLHPLLEV
ncbi:hypothetical protein OAF99_00505 [Akkermansiaceae bacterium]|nr:hypothetical protein [Akkermansiaceae bacterium]